MSIEDDFRAALVAHAPLVAVVGDNIEQNGVDTDTPVPYVVFTTSHDITSGLDGTPLVDQATISVECWGASALEADQVADLVVAALVAHAPPANCATLTGRATGYDGDIGLDATVLSLEWWS